MFNSIIHVKVNNRGGLC